MRIITLSLFVCFLTLTADGQKIFDTGEKCPDDEERLLINLRLSNAQMFEDFKRSIYKDAEDIYRRLTTLESKVFSTSWASGTVNKVLGFTVHVGIDFQYFPGFKSNGESASTSNTKWAYFQGSLYFLTLEKRTWKTAQEICAQNRSRLVEIETEQEHDFIVNNIYEPNSPNGGFVWLGATYNKSESKFVWSSTGLPLGFSFWRAGEPKATTDVTDCVHVHVKEKGIWDTTPCGYSFSYLCELKIT